MGDIPKKRQSYLDEIVKSIESDDAEKLSAITRGREALPLRYDMSEALGQHVAKNYDEPLSIFKNQKLLEEVPVSYANLPPEIAGSYTKEKGILLPKADPSKLERQMGVKLHEYGHPNDIINKFEDSVPFNKVTAKIGGTGLEAAEKAIGQHHKVGFFEKEALTDLLKNRKLASLVPLLKVAGPAAAAYGMFQGDAFAADPTGMLQTDELGKGSDTLPEEQMKEKERFNKTMKRLLNK